MAPVFFGYSVFFCSRVENNRSSQCIISKSNCKQPFKSLFNGENILICKRSLFYSIYQRLPLTLRKQFLVQHPSDIFNIESSTSPIHHAIFIMMHMVKFGAQQVDHCTTCQCNFLNSPFNGQLYIIMVQRMKHIITERLCSYGNEIATMVKPLGHGVSALPPAYPPTCILT